MTVNIYEKKVQESKVQSNSVPGVIRVQDLTRRAVHYGVLYPPHHLCNSNTGISRNLISSSSSSGSSIRISNFTTHNLGAPKRKMNSLLGSKGLRVGADVGVRVDLPQAHAPKQTGPTVSAARLPEVVRFLKTAYWEAGWAIQSR